MKSLLFVLRLFPTALVAFGAGPAVAAATNNVVVGNYNYTPRLLTITNGDTVLWTNPSGIAHDTTSSNGFWASPQFMSPTTFSFKFNNTGSFPYHCQTHQLLHPEQNGTVTVLAAQNIPPSVSVTNPPNNATFTAPATFVIGARASDSDGTVSQVEFFQGATSLGVDTTSPYSATANNLAAGNYTISAVARDNSGAKATNSIAVVVLNPPTPVTLLSPGLDGGLLQFSFATEAGHQYVVEFTTQLQQPSSAWHTLTNITGNGSSAIVNDSTGGNQRFYRVGVQ